MGSLLAGEEFWQVRETLILKAIQQVFVNVAALCDRHCQGGPSHFVLPPFGVLRWFVYCALSVNQTPAYRDAGIAARGSAVIASGPISSSILGAHSMWAGTNRFGYGLKSYVCGRLAVANLG